MAKRPTLAQMETLVEFLEQNVGIAKGLLRTNQAKMEIKRQWASVAITLNSLGGANKDGQGWAKYWAEKKCALKKLCAQHSKSMRRAGGGSSDDLPMLSELDKRLVAVMGGQEFAVRDSQLAVDPFHHTEHQMTQSVPAASQAENVNLDLENQAAVIGSCTSPIPGTSQDTPQSPPRKKSKLKSIPHVRHRSATRNNKDMERLVQIGEQRVRAENITAQALADVSAALERNVQIQEQRVKTETITAQAFADVSAALDRNAVAVANIGRALEGLSAVINNAIIEFAKKNAMTTNSISR
ncbi:unnamed protein product [Parnassius apollo]|uniref:(apollo) hypothetical protein n=1 Tax=Parnassius apollo TaxID=110799 RepID=A0A8S3YHH9_PARAO|nr:unnamed protein product [Parnassius apollo]